MGLPVQVKASLTIANEIPVKPSSTTTSKTTTLTTRPTAVTGKPTEAGIDYITERYVEICF